MPPLEYVVVGGGISGVTVVEELARVCGGVEPESSQPVRITLLHTSDTLTRITGTEQRTERREEVTGIGAVEFEQFRVAQALPAHVELRLLRGRLLGLDTEKKIIQYTNDDDDESCDHTASVLHNLPYTRVCICTGARPNEFASCDGANSPVASPHIRTVRDAASIAALARELATPVPPPPNGGPSRAKRVCIVGNGGIALELVHALRTSQLSSINAGDAVADVVVEAPAPPLALPPLTVDWIVKDAFLGAPFLDRMASAFLMAQLFPDPAAASDKAPPATHAANPTHSSTEAIVDEEEQMVSVERGRHVRTRYVVPAAAGGAASSSAAAASADAVVLAADSSPSAVALPSPPSTSVGPALGPNWLNQLHLDTNKPKYIFERERALRAQAAAQAAAQDANSSLDAAASAAVAASPVDLSLSLNCEVVEVRELPLVVPDGCRLSLTLTDGRLVECDLLVAATGVRPNTDWCPASLTRDDAGAILVDECMRSSLSDVFAAGDCAAVRFTQAASSHFTLLRPNLFHSARLWTHAKLIGLYAARAMSGAYEEEVRDLDGFNLMMFAHGTQLLGRKTILLGRHNLQGYTASEVRTLKQTGRLRTLVRCKPHGCEELIKLHLVDGRLVGALLIGGDETADLEETFENLMLNQIDLTQFGDFLNDVDVDIADYFD